MSATKTAYSGIRMPAPVADNQRALALVLAKVRQHRQNQKRATNAVRRLSILAI